MNYEFFSGIEKYFLLLKLRENLNPTTARPFQVAIVIPFFFVFARK